MPTAYPYLKATIKDVEGNVIEERGPVRADKIDIGLGVRVGGTVEVEVTKVDISHD